MTNEEYNNIMLKNLFEHRIEKDGTFKFTCKMCGSCCRKRKEPIIITGPDIFHIAKALEISPPKVLEKHTRWYVGDGSKCPVVVLKERPDGSCSLLRNSKCMVQKEKPSVCAIYPLGRAFTGDTLDIIYFEQEGDCPGAINGEEHTLQDWLDSFNIDARNEEMRAWYKLMMGISNYTRNYKGDSKDLEPQMLLFLILLYMDYDPSKDYIEQVKRNIERVKEIVPSIKFME